MRNLSLGILVAALLSVTAVAQEGNVTLQIEGLSEVTGNVFVAVYDSGDTWLGDEVATSAKVTITESLKDGLVETRLQLAPGVYAMTVFYDEDGDGELDTNFIGIPKEPIAMSNNAKMKFGPPKYEDAKFEVGEEPVVQLIRMESL